MSKEISQGSARYIFLSKDRSITPANPQARILAANHGMNLTDGQPSPLTRAQMVAIIRTARLNNETAPEIMYSVTLSRIQIENKPTPPLRLTPHFTFDVNGKRTGVSATVSCESSDNDPHSKILQSETFISLLPSLVASAHRDRRPMGFLIVSPSKHTTGQLDMPDEKDDIRQNTMTARIEKTLRSADIAVRLNDGGFGILLTSVNDLNGKDGLTKAAYRYANALNQSFPDTAICMGVARLGPLPINPSTETGAHEENFDPIKASDNLFGYADCAWSHAIDTARKNSTISSSIFLHDPSAESGLRDLSPSPITSKAASQGEALQS